MAGRRGGVVVPISTTYDNKGLREANRQLSTFGKTVTKSFMGFGAALGGALAFGTITQQLGQMARAAAEDQKSLVALGKAMDNLGMSAQRSGVEQFIEGTMLATGVADDQLRPAMARLLRSTEDVEEAQKALGIALDLSAATGKSLDTVANGLGKAYDGNAASLGRLGVGLDKALLKSGDMSRITSELSKKFGGQATAAAASYAGQMERVNVAAAEAQETIGYALLNSLNEVSAAFGGTDGAIGAITDLGETTANMVTGIGQMTAALVDLVAGLQEADKESIDWGDTLTRYLPGFLQPSAVALQYFADAGEETRRSQEALNEELLKSKAIRDMYVLDTDRAADADNDAADAADRRATKIKKLQDALNGPARNMIAANLRLREMRRSGPQDTDGTKGLSRDERLSFGLSYAGAVEDKYQLLVGQDKFKKADALLANARQYLGNQGLGGFAERALATPAMLTNEISRRDSARGAESYRTTMSSVFGGQVTINVNAETPQQAVEKAKQWARLSAAGRGLPMRGTQGASNSAGAPQSWGGIQ